MNQFLQRLDAAIAELQTVRQALAEKLPGNPEVDWSAKCSTCEHFNDSRAYCNHWRAEVPRDAQRAGCDQWVDVIPF